MSGVSHVYYRGSLAFCNYTCSYCPFSKRKGGASQLERDREQLFRFARKIGAEGSGGFSGTVQFVPYGEALIHEYYWQGMAELSAFPHIEAVGAQSNFSFPVKERLRRYRSFGGDVEKLRLWGTFHPEMTSVGDFLGQCGTLAEAGVSFCVGAVGAPEHLDALWELRHGLDPSVYMWINKMDGMGRPYTEGERKSFLEIDKYFKLELRHIRPDRSACASSVLVLGNGDMQPCVLCHEKMGNLYADGLPNYISREYIFPECARTWCDCFLAYGSRNDIEELRAFGAHPAFRIVSGERNLIYHASMDGF